MSCFIPGLAVLNASIPVALTSLMGDGEEPLSEAEGTSLRSAGRTNHMLGSRL
jgi:hypothetical protein